jgi:hypothetical protein
MRFAKVLLQAISSRCSEARETTCRETPKKSGGAKGVMAAHRSWKSSLRADFPKSLCLDRRRGSLLEVVTIILDTTGLTIPLQCRLIL